MKKKNLKGLKLNKKNVSNLNPEQVTGGVTQGGCTIGCTDGCTPFQTAWNCTRGGCSNDCDNGWTYICSNICPSGELICEAPE